MKTAVLFINLVLFTTNSLSAPAILPDYNFTTTNYIKFFKVQELIDNINIKNFDKHHGSPIKDQDQISVGEMSEILAEDISNGLDTVNIDLTGEAILTDKVTVVESVIPESIKEEVTQNKITKPVKGALLEDDVTNGEEAPEEEVDETSDIITKITKVDSQKVISLDSTTLKYDENNDAFNIIDTGNGIEKISDETSNSADRFGYKILVKKVGTTEIAVGKIKFEVSTSVEKSSDDETSGNSIDNNTKSHKEITTAAPVSVTTTIKDEEVTTEQDIDIVSVVDLRSETTTEHTEITTNTPTEITYPVTAVLPSIDVLDEETIIEGIMKVKEDAEIAVAEIQTQDKTETMITFPSCNVSLTDIEDMLSNLATRISVSAPLLGQILTTGQDLRLETDTHTLARGGAKLLNLLEPFLESLVPATQVSSCADSSSTTMLMSLSEMASQLDVIADREPDILRADQLHRSATSLQLAAWIMSQLQTSIHTFYNPEGLCDDDQSSTVEILGSLSRAISGYIPIIGLMGNQMALDQLVETVTRLDNAQAEISRLLEQSGLTSLPVVECGANFSSLGGQLNQLADFIEAIPQDYNQ